MPVPYSPLHEALCRETVTPGRGLDIRLDLSDLAAEEIRKYCLLLEDVQNRLRGAARICATLTSIAGDDDCGVAAPHVLSEAAWHMGECLQMAEDLDSVTFRVRQLAKDKEGEQ